MLTARQRDCLLYVQRFQRGKGGVSPSLKEIADAIGLRSRGSVYALLKGLEARGHIRRLPNRDRAIEILRPIPVAEVFKWCDASKKLKPLNVN